MEAFPGISAELHMRRGAVFPTPGDASTKIQDRGTHVNKPFFTVPKGDYSRVMVWRLASHCRWSSAEGLVECTALWLGHYTVFSCSMAERETFAQY